MFQFLKKYSCRKRVGDNSIKKFISKYIINPVISIFGIKLISCLEPEKESFNKLITKLKQQKNEGKTKTQMREEVIQFYETNNLQIDGLLEAIDDIYSIK